MSVDCHVQVVAYCRVGFGRVKPCCSVWLPAAVVEKIADDLAAHEIFDQHC